MLAVGIARRFDRLGQLSSKPVVRQPHQRDAVDRAIDVAGQPRDQRIGARAAAEERHRRRRCT